MPTVIGIDILEPTFAQLHSVPELVTAIVFLIISWITVLLRVYVRVVMIHSFGWDDWLCLTSQLLFTTMCSLTFVVDHIEITQSIAGPDALSLQVCLIVVLQVYVLTTITFKLSLAGFFLRLVDRPWQRRIIYASAALCTIIGLVMFFVLLFNCGNPTNYVRNELLGDCLDWSTNLAPIYYIHGSINAIADWVFAILPIFDIWSAQLRPKAKISVTGILVLGVGGSIASFVRLGYIHYLGGDIFSLYTKVTPLYIVSIVEIGSGITAVSLATLRPLFSQCVDKASHMGHSLKRVDGKGFSVQVLGHGMAVSRKVEVAYERDAELESLPPFRPSSRNRSGPMDKDFLPTRVHGERIIVAIEPYAPPTDWNRSDGMAARVPEPAYTRWERTTSESSDKPLLSGV